MATERQTEFLRTAADWEKWNEAFISRAIVLQIWVFIKPDRQPGDIFEAEPRVPNIEDFEPIGVVTRSAAAAAPAVENQTSQQPWERSYSRAIQNYSIREKIFNKQSTAVANLEAWIQNTVEISLRTIAFKATDNLARRYARLRELVMGSPRDAKAAIIIEYEELTKPGKPVADLMEWIVRWNDILNRGTALDIQAFREPVYWSPVLFKVISNWDADWTRAYHMANYRKIELEELSRMAITKELNTHFEGKKLISKGGKIQRGAFAGAPRFGGEEAASTESNTEKKGGASHKRDYSTADKVQCFACEMSHRLARCYYVFPAQMPDGFYLNSDLQEKVDQRLRENAELREEVEAIKGKRAKGQEGSRGRRGRGKRGGRKGASERGKEPEKPAPAPERED